VNRLHISDRVRVVAALVEGSSINATCRMTGVAKHTVLKLLRDMGCAAASYHDSQVRNLRVRRLQCDEIWAFVYAKQKNVTLEQMQQGAGDVVDVDGHRRRYQTDRLLHAGGSRGLYSTELYA
jgi:hypothetical protein